MFYFDELNGYRILRSDFLDNKRINAFFSLKGHDNIIHTNLAEKRITPNQTHSDHIEYVDVRLEYPDTDGLILDKTDTLICLRFADCTPLIFYDPIKHACAISHAGWRGTASKIGVKTVQKMGKILGSNPQDLIAIIGPAISVCCYEVSEEVKNTLLSTVNNIEGLFIDKNVDLKKINARQLEEIGITKIDICPYCTSCNNDLFYSYRKENGTTKRHYAAAKLLN